MTKAKTETRAVAISSVDLSSYVAVSTPAQEIAELFTDNFGGEKLDVFSLTTIKVPSGGRSNGKSRLSMDKSTIPPFRALSWASKKAALTGHRGLTMETAALLQTVNRRTLRPA